MNLTLWIVAVILAVAFLGAGFNKIVQPKAKLQANEQFAWVEDFSTPVLKAVGALEVLGAIGLILPQATGTAEVLTPLAAVGLALVQVGAFATHLRRHETKILPVNVVLLAATIFVALGRFITG